MFLIPVSQWSEELRKMIACIKINPIFMSLGDNRDILWSPVSIKPRKQTLAVKRIGMNLCCTMWFYICLYRVPDLSMFSLKHSECRYRRLVMRGEGTMEVGQHCSEPTSCSTWDSCSVPSPPIHFLKKDRLCKHEQNSVKNLVFIGGMHQAN